MSASASRGGSSDALSDLLADMKGVEGNIFSRPKTLGGMKRVQQTPSKPVNTPSKPPLAPTSGSITTPSSFPGQSAASTEPHTTASHSIDDLENLLKQSTPSVAPLSSQAPSTATSQLQGDAGFEWSFETATTATPQNPPSTSNADFSDPFADFVASSAAPQPTPSSAPITTLQEDPLEMFGGTPAPSKPPMNTSHSSDDFFADFTQASETQKPPSPPARAAAAAEPLSQTATAARTPDTIPASEPPVSIAGGSSFRDRMSEPAAQPTGSHKAFQFLDAKTAGPAAADGPLGGGASRVSSRMSVSSSGAALAAGEEPSYQMPPASQDHHHHHLSGAGAAEGVVELGHKAAKFLQTGTKWFMKASKQIASEVQSKIEKHRQHHGSDGGGGGLHGYGHSSDNADGGAWASDGGYNNPNAAALNSFYYDWAAQIARMSPGTKAAALGAMQEEDRLAVQRIMDEAELGETVLEQTIQASDGPMGQGFAAVEERKNLSHQEPSNAAQGARKASQSAPEELPPPPSYEEVMAAASATPSAAAPRPATAPPAATSEDLLGMHHAGSTQAPPPSHPSVHTPEDDLLKMDSAGHDGTTPTPSAGPSSQRSGSASHIDDMFTVPATTTAKPSSAPPRRMATPTAAGGLDSMIDMGEALPDVDTAGYDELYKDKDAGVADANEPEIRKQLRQKRIAEKHERMMRQLAEKRAREEAEDAEKAGKVAYRDTLKPKIDAWSNGKKDNIRALLSTLHTVLWEDSGWTKPSIADMVDPGKVKKWYMKANLVVHPDKVKQKGGTLEQVTIADMVFDVLKAAWGKFESSK